MKWLIKIFNLIFKKKMMKPLKTHESDVISDVTLIDNKDIVNDIPILNERKNIKDSVYAADIDDELNNIFSSYSYGKKTGYSVLLLKVLEEKYRKYALGLINRMPAKSGIYFYKNNNQIEYIGQAINMKKRTAEHFFASDDTVSFDRFLRLNPLTYKISFEECLVKELSKNEREAIKKYNPKHNHAVSSPSRITSKYTIADTSQREKGMQTTELIDANGLIYTISGRFKDKQGKTIPRTIINQIVGKLGGQLSSKGSKATYLWIIGEKSGQNTLKVDHNDIEINHPFKIKKFESEYLKR